MQSQCYYNTVDYFPITAYSKVSSCTTAILCKLAFLIYRRTTCHDLFAVNIFTFNVVEQQQNKFAPFTLFIRVIAAHKQSFPLQAVFLQLSLEVNKSKKCSMLCYVTKKTQKAIHPKNLPVSENLVIVLLLTVKRHCRPFQKC